MLVMEYMDHGSLHGICMCKGGGHGECQAEGKGRFHFDAPNWVAALLLTRT